MASSKDPERRLCSENNGDDPDCKTCIPRGRFEEMVKEALEHKFWEGVLSISEATYQASKSRPSLTEAATLAAVHATMTKECQRIDSAIAKARKKWKYSVKHNLMSSSSTSSSKKERKKKKTKINNDKSNSKIPDPPSNDSTLENPKKEEEEENENDKPDLDDSEIHDESITSVKSKEPKQYAEATPFTMNRRPLRNDVGTIQKDLIDLYEYRIHQIQYQFVKKPAETASIWSCPKAVKNATRELAKYRRMINEIYKVNLKSSFEDENPCTPDEIYDNFMICPICFEEMGESPRFIFCCSRGHGTCYLCLSNGPIKNCASCREDFEVRPPTRSVFAEKIVSKLIRYRDYRAAKNEIEAANAEAAQKAYLAGVEADISVTEGESTDFHSKADPQTPIAVQIPRTPESTPVNEDEINKANTTPVDGAIGSCGIDNVALSESLINLTLHEQDDDEAGEVTSSK